MFCLSQVTVQQVYHTRLLATCHDAFVKTNSYYFKHHFFINTTVDAFLQRCKINLWIFLTNYLPPKSTRQWTRILLWQQVLLFIKALQR